MLLSKETEKNYTWQSTIPIKIVFIYNVKTMYYFIVSRKSIIKRKVISIGWWNLMRKKYVSKVKMIQTSRTKATELCNECYDLWLQWTKRLICINYCKLPTCKFISLLLSYIFPKNFGSDFKDKTVYSNSEILKFFNVNS